MALDLVRHNGHCFMQVAGLEISFLFKRAHRAEFFLGVEHICEHVRATHPLDEDGGWWLSTILAAERLLEIENKVPYSSTQSLEKWWAICFGGGRRDSDENVVEEGKWQPLFLHVRYYHPANTSSLSRSRTQPPISSYCRLDVTYN